MQVFSCKFCEIFKNTIFTENGSVKLELEIVKLEMKQVLHIAHVN